MPRVAPGYPQGIPTESSGNTQGIPRVRPGYTQGNGWGRVKYRNEDGLGIKIVIPARRIDPEQGTSSGPGAQRLPEVDKPVKSYSESIDKDEHLRAREMPGENLASLELAQAAAEPSKINSMDIDGRTGDEKQEMAVDQSTSADVDQASKEQLQTVTGSLTNSESSQGTQQPSENNAMDIDSSTNQEQLKTPIDNLAGDVQAAQEQIQKPADNSQAVQQPSESNPIQEQCQSSTDNSVTLNSSRAIQHPSETIPPSSLEHFLIAPTKMEVDVSIHQQQPETAVSNVAPTRMKADVIINQQQPERTVSNNVVGSEMHHMEIDSTGVGDHPSEAPLAKPAEEQVSTSTENTSKEQVAQRISTDLGQMAAEANGQSEEWVFQTIEVMRQSLSMEQEAKPSMATKTPNSDEVEVKPPSLSILDQPGLFTMDDDPAFSNIDPVLQVGKALDSAAVPIDHEAQNTPPDGMFLSLHLDPPADIRRQSGEMQVDGPANDPPKAAAASPSETTDQKGSADGDAGSGNSDESKLVVAVVQNIDSNPSDCLQQHVLAAIPKQVLEALEEAQQHRSLSLELIAQLESDLCSPKQRTMTEIREQIREIDHGYTIVQINERRIHELWEQIDGIQKTADQEEQRKLLAAKYRKLTNMIKALKDSLETVSNQRADAVKAEIARNRKERDQVKAALVAMDLGVVEEPVKAEEVEAPREEQKDHGQPLEPSEQPEDSEQEDSEQEEESDGEAKPKQKGKLSSHEHARRRAEAKERKKIMTAAAIAKIRARIAGKSLHYPLFGAEEDIRKSMEKLAGMSKEQKAQLQRACTKSVTKFLKTGELSDLTPRTRKALVNLDRLMPHESLATKELVIALHTNTKLNTQCRFHKDQTKTKVYDGCATNIVEGVGFKATYNKSKDDGVRPPELMHCGCTIEDMLIDFFLFKTVKAAARAPSLRGWTEGMKADGFSPRQRAFVVDMFKFWTQLDAEDLYSVSRERSAELKELDLRLISIRKHIAYWREKTGIPIELKFPEMPPSMPQAHTK
ncbi:hypothetical protein CVT26_014829 [Gymnopilus dilepis]|uniref:Uncharacterized protein n=1 Tax=Gymnopilus dilepis TaxID=231916 RepID=A0A409YXN2_9AGAR|nr:hypothetical protein CVT26_014829 [Gymnopilus dilepis]